WFQYCSERETSPILPTLETVVEFLTSQYSKGLGYESLNTARGALSALDLEFDGFRKVSPVEHFSLKDLTLKLVMLMALTQAAHVHTLHLLNFKCYKKLLNMCYNLMGILSKAGPDIMLIVFRFELILQKGDYAFILF
ncbi:hypothetical protein MAR_013735, partial [Mya arenaria]